MKQILIINAAIMLSLTPVVFANNAPEKPQITSATVSSSNSGIYVGLNGGWGFTNYRNDAFVSIFGAGVQKDDGIVGRIFLGYDLNKHFAIETGYSCFFNNTNFASSTQNIKTSAIDLYGKGKIQAVKNLDIYAKIGAAYLHTIDKNTYVGNLHNINVAFGTGADYTITPNIITNIEWSHIMGCKQTDRYIPDTDAFMIGLRYKFDL